MKLFVAVAALAVTALATVQAASESTIHIRVHIPDDAEVDQEKGYDSSPVSEWGQCKYNGQPLRTCASGTVCREQDDYYGQCIRNPAIQYGQCGGKGWTGQCAVSSNTCKRTSDYYAQCVPN
ncbi:hypothetical protein Gpo141_00014868 [Globisporangium polare]